MSSTFHERQKAEAVARLHLMGLREEYIQDFEQNGTIHVSVEKGIEPTSLTDDEKEMINRFREELGITIYLAVRSTFPNLGVMDTLFFVHPFERRWPADIDHLKDGYEQALTISYQDSNLLEYGLTAFHSLPNGEIIRER